MIEIVLLGVVILLLVGGGVLILRAVRPAEENSLLRQQIESLRVQMSEAIESNRRATAEELHRVTQTMNDRLKENRESLDKVTGDVGRRLDNAGQVISGVQNKLGVLEESTKRILAVGQDIAGLESILKSPKFRGGIGELFLADLLAEMLPRSHFKLQYQFTNRETVDAVVILGEGMVPVDSKFPLENFRRLLDASPEQYGSFRKAFFNDVRKHVDAIASKYILPDEGTFDFALMYIPAENVYYETIVKDERDPEDVKAINAYALSRRVIPVSPNSFYAYLQAILLGLKGMQVEKNARNILDELKRLNKEFGDFQEDFRVVGKHFSSARSRYDEAEKHLSRFGDRLRGIESGVTGTLDEGEEKEKTLPLLS